MADEPSIAFQKSIVNTGLNSAVLLAFLVGAYTVIHFGTLYLYMTRKAPQRLLVAGAMSALWILAMMLLGSIWFGVNWCIVVQGATREDIVRCSPPAWIALIQDLAEFPIVVIADVLLIWRCFNVWDKSLRATAIPLFLMLAEIGTFLAALIAISVDKFKPNSKQATVYNSLLAAAFFLSFASTLVTTVLIGYRIWSLTRHRTTPMGRYKHIFEILVQSSAVYALAMLAQAIQGFLPESFAFKYPLREWALQTYMVNVVYPIACIAPTIMVARVALLDSDNMHTSTTRVLSDLQFQLGSTRLDDTRTRLDTAEVELENLDGLDTREKGLTT